MISIHNQMAAQIPSAFGAPVCGHAFETALRSTTTTGIATSVVRDRKATLVKGDMSIALAYFPGTSAWRPPPC